MWCSPRPLCYRGTAGARCGKCRVSDIILRDVCKCGVSFYFFAHVAFAFFSFVRWRAYFGRADSTRLTKIPREAPFSFRSPVHPRTTRLSVCHHNRHSRRPLCKRGREFSARGNRISVILLDHLVTDPDFSRPAAPLKVVSSFSVKLYRGLLLLHLYSLGAPLPSIVCVVHFYNRNKYK